MNYSLPFLLSCKFINSCLCVCVCFVDNEVPLISGCISTLTSNALPGQAFDNLNWVEPTATDNAGQVNMTGTHVPGAMYYIGDTTVTFTAVDDSGNIAMCIFVITILGEF